MRAIRGVAVAVAATFALALSACGGTEPGTADESDTTTTDDKGESGADEVAESLNFSAKTVEGEAFEGASLAGKPVVLWFWAPWCPKCQGASDEVAKAAKANADVNVVGVAGLDESVDNMTAFVADHGIDEITNLADPDGEVWKKFEITPQHTYVLIDADGKVTFTGGIDDADLGGEIAELAG